MNRLAKKCVISSAILHGSLCGVLLICSAFGTKTEQPPSFIEMVPFGGNFKVTDGQSTGGAAAPAPEPVKKAEPPTPTPPTPAPQKREVAEVEPPKPVVRKVERVEPKEEVVVKEKGDIAPPKHSPKPVKVVLNPIVRNTSKKTVTKKSTRPDTEEQEGIAESTARKKQQQLANNLMGIANDLARTTANRVVSESYGEGSGGTAFVNYRTVVFTYYYNAWQTPDEFDDAEATTTARIVVARDGRIISAELDKRSGKASLDRSVERALQSVRKLPAFPESTRDSQRTFLLRFNLKSKFAIG